MKPKVINEHKAPYTRQLLAVAVSMALLPNAGISALLPADIKKLPQTGEISDIRAGQLVDGVLAFAWQGSEQIYAQHMTAAGALTGELETYAGFDEIGMDDDGDFTVDVSEDNSLLVQKYSDDSEQSIEVNAAQNVNSYEFDEGNKKNKRVEFALSYPVIAHNAAGDFVVLWEESKTETRRKVQKTCSTDEYGGQYCEDGYRYATHSTVRMYAQRYNSNMSKKDVKPLLVAVAHGAKRYMGDTAVQMDNDGDFTVAYSAGKSKPGDEYGYGEGNTRDNSDVFVKQFAKKNGKFVAGRTIRVSGKPKMSSGHKAKNVRHKEPAIVVTDEKTNAFIIMWHNDYEDHFQVKGEPEEVCVKYKKDEYGYKECTKYEYKSVYEDQYEAYSILKAKRYANQ